MASVSRFQIWNVCSETSANTHFWVQVYRKGRKKNSRVNILLFIPIFSRYTWYFDMWSLEKVLRFSSLKKLSYQPPLNVSWHVAAETWRNIGGQLHCSSWTVCLRCKNLWVMYYWNIETLAIAWKSLEKVQKFWKNI